MPVPFTIDFTAPNAPTNVVATPLKLLRAPEFDAAQITWSPVTTPPENLLRQELWMNDGVDWTRIGYWSDPAVKSFVYPFPRSRKSILYQINQIVRVGAATQTGLWGADDLTVTLNHLSLVSIREPQTIRFAASAWESQRVAFKQAQDWHFPAGGRDPVEMPGSLSNREVSISPQLYDRVDGVTAEQSYLDFETLFDSKHIFCLRDPRGNKWFSRFLGDPTDTFGKGGVRHNFDIQVRRVAYQEGV
jgi:hypothetical protein